MIAEKHTESSDPLFGTQKSAILDIWNQMQRLQTDFAFAQELSFYHTTPQWHAANTVLDLGTGNGYYLRKLAASFPRKMYHGADMSGELIGIATKETHAGNIFFSQRGCFEVTERYDFVIMRLLLQHLEDVPAVLDHAATLTNIGGGAVIVDAHDPYRFFHPELPEFRAFFTAYAEHERKAGRDRRVASRVEQAIRASKVWRPGPTLPLLIPSTVGSNMDLFTKTYSLLVDLVEQAGEIQYDFSSVKQAWSRWAQSPEAYTQVGLNLIFLERI